MTQPAASMAARVMLAGAMVAVLTGNPSPSFAQQAPPPDVQLSDAQIKAMVGLFKKQVEDKLQKQLEATDAEFEVLYPRIEKVQQLLMAMDASVGYGLLLSRPQPVDKNAPADKPKEPTPFPTQSMNNIMRVIFDLDENEAYQKAKELFEAVQASDVPASVLKERLAALREARKRVQNEVERARSELRGMCTTKQEAMLMMLGILD